MADQRNLAERRWLKGISPTMACAAKAVGHMENALRSDFAWWPEHRERIAARVERWLAVPARTPGQLAR
jgi:hypothetical protein